MAESTKKKPSGKKPNELKIGEIQKLVDMLEKSNLNDLELEMKGVNLRLSKGSSNNVALPPPPQSVVMVPSSAPMAPAMPSAGQQPSSVQAPPSAPPVEEKDSAAAVSDKAEAVTSPMVGTFYRAPAPGAEPFVKIGDNVKEGQVLCIIEAMKLMNDLECEIEGKVVDILVQNAQPVEFGEKLFIIEPVG